MLRITLGDHTFADFADDKMPVAEGIALKKVSGLTPPRLWDGVNDFDPEAIKALVWLAGRREGAEVRYSELDFDLGDFTMVEIDEAGRKVRRDPKTREITHLDGEPVEPPDPTPGTTT